LSKQVLEKLTKIKPDNKNLHNYTLKIAIASSFNTLGDTYFAISKNNDKYLDSTLIYYKKAFHVSEEFNPKHKNSSSLYNLRLANVLIKRKEFKKALEKVNSYELDHKSQSYHFLKSIIFKNLKINDSSYYHSYKFLNFKNSSPSTEKNKIAIFNILADLYNSSNKIDSAFKYSKLALDKLKILNKSKTEANKNHYLYDFEQIKKVNDSIINKEIKTKINLIITFLLITILIITIGLYLLKKEKKRSSENLTTPKKDYSINLELEEMVLRELENFEISEIYLDSTFNINKLAKQLNTNTSYLSSIVNERKGKTYKQYITELRMNYLLNLINKESKYRKYTVEALGNKIGYTNASSFSRSFKNFTGLSPSEYLNSLNNDVT
jgi:AraC-like DNA-binding protein